MNQEIIVSFYFNNDLWFVFLRRDSTKLFCTVQCANILWRVGHEYAAINVIARNIMLTFQCISVYPTIKIRRASRNWSAANSMAFWLQDTRVHVLPYILHTPLTHHVHEHVQSSTGCPKTYIYRQRLIIIIYELINYSHEKNNSQPHVQAPWETRCGRQNDVEIAMHEIIRKMREKRPDENAKWDFALHRKLIKKKVIELFSLRWIVIETLIH